MWLAIGIDAVGSRNSITFVHAWFWHEFLDIFKKVTFEPECIAAWVGSDHFVPHMIPFLEKQLKNLYENPIQIQDSNLYVSFNAEHTILALDRGLFPHVSGNKGTGSEYCIGFQVCDLIVTVVRVFVAPFPFVFVCLFQPGPKSLLKHVLFITIPIFQNDHFHRKWEEHSSHQEAFTDLRQQLLADKVFKSSTPKAAQLKAMYEVDTELVIKHEWSKMRSAPIFSSLFNVWFEPIVFHGLFHLLMVFWMVSLALMDRATAEFLHMKETVVGYEGWDQLKQYINCQNIFEATLEYVSSLSFFTRKQCGCVNKKVVSRCNVGIAQVTAWCEVLVRPKTDM